MSTASTAVARTVRHLPDATAGVVLATVLVYLLPFRLVVPPLSVLGRPGIIVCLGLMLWWTLTRLHPGLVTRDRQPMRWALAGYLAALGASYLAGHARGLPELEANSADRTLLMALAGAGMLLACADGIRTRDGIDQVLRWLCWVGTAMALIALSQFALRVDVTNHLQLPPVLRFHQELVGLAARGTGLVRVAGTAGHFIEFSVLMVLGLIVSIHYARFSENRRDRQVYAVLALVQAGVIPLALSRTGLLALASAVLLLALVWPLRTTVNVLIAGIALAALIQVLRPGLLATLRALVLAGDRDPSVQGRLEDYDYLMPFIRERPWFGRGVGTFVPELYRILDNQWLMSLVTTGIVGVAGLAALLLTGVALANRVRRLASRARDRDLAAVLAVGIGVAAISAVAFDALYFSTYLVTLHLMLGLAGALWRVTRADRNDRGGPLAAPKQTTQPEAT